MARVQRIAEGQSYDVRDALLRYSEIVDAQRRIVHDERRQVLCGEDTAERHDLDRFDPETASRLARRLRLLAIDAVWAEHLAFTAEIREGIHLVGVGGMTPLDEFVRQVTAAFQDLDERIQIEWLRRCADLPDRAEDIDWHDQGLRGPASTWTYLVEDDVFENRIAAALVGNRDIGFSSGAALLGPLLALWAILRRRQRRR
jgi:preprotein translocase subunit SecA